MIMPSMAWQGPADRVLYVPGPYAALAAAYAMFGYGAFTSAAVVPVAVARKSLGKKAKTGRKRT